MGVKRKSQPGPLYDREAAFVREKRKDPSAPYAVLLRKAGYKGTDRDMRTRLYKLLARPAVMAALTAPRPTKDSAPEEIDTVHLKREVLVELRRILRDQRASSSDKIKAADKLLATIPGAYVPVGVHHTGSLTLDNLLNVMEGKEDAPGKESADPEVKH